MTETLPANVRLDDEFYSAHLFRPPDQGSQEYVDGQEWASLAGSKIRLSRPVATAHGGEPTPPPAPEPEAASVASPDVESSAIGARRLGRLTLRLGDARAASDALLMRTASPGVGPSSQNAVVLVARGQEGAGAREARILSEETYYGQGTGSFKVLLIERPLVGPVRPLPAQPAHLPDPMARDWPSVRRFLHGFPENELVLRKAERNLEAFARSYIVVRGFEGQLVDRVLAMCTDTLEQLVCTCPDFRLLYHGSDQQLASLTQLVTDYVVGHAELRDKLLAALSDVNAADDEALHYRMANLSQLQPSNLGVRLLPQLDEPAAAGPQSSPPPRTGEGTGTFTAVDEALEAVALLRDLSLASTPSEALSTVGLAVESVHASLDLAAQAAGEGGGGGADDMLPVFVIALLRAAPRQLQTWLDFLKHFGSNIGSSSLGYYLATLTASVEYIQSGQILKNVPPEPVSERLGSPPPPKRVTRAFRASGSIPVAFQSSPLAKAGVPRLTSAGVEPKPRKPGVPSKLLTSPAKSSSHGALAGYSYAAPPPVIEGSGSDQPDGGGEGLGDFLSSLKSDVDFTGGQNG